MAIGQGSTFKVAYAPTQVIYDNIASPDTATLYFVGDTQNIILDGIRYGFNQAEDAPFATQAEAEAGLLANVYMSPQRVANYVANLAGVANGLATLDATGVVPASQLPSYVDDIIEGYLNAGNFYEDAGHTTLITPETSKIYVDLANNLTYRWSGSAYIEISKSLALGTTSSTAFPGDRGLALEAYFVSGNLFLKSTGTTSAPSHAVVFEYSNSGGTEVQTELNVNLQGTLLYEGQTVWHAGNLTPGNYLLRSGGTMAGDITMEKDGSANVGSHGVVFQANTTALGDFTKELNMNTAGELLFAGDAVWYEGNFDPTDYVAKAGGTMTGSLTMNASLIIGQELAGTTNKDSLPITFSYKEDSVNKTLNLLVDENGNLKIGTGVIYHTNNIPTPGAIGALPITGGTLTGDLTLQKDGSTNVGSHGVVFQGNTLSSDFTKELNMSQGGVLQFAGNNVYYEGNEPVTWTVLS